MHTAPLTGHATAFSPAPQATSQEALQHVGAAPTKGVGHDGHGVADAALLNRVGRVLQDIAAARVVSDAEIRQHAVDCTWLMERAYARFEAGDPHARDEAIRWMHERDNALRSLSPAWKAAREAQIQREIDEGCGYFVEQGDAARARIAGGRG